MPPRMKEITGHPLFAISLRCCQSRFRRLTESAVIRVVLPHHLKNLARVAGEISLEVKAPVTVQTILDTLEDRYPMLKGTVREHGTQKRRPRVRFYVNKEDISHDPPDQPLPESIVAGREPFIIIGAISGG